MSELLLTQICFLTLFVLFAIVAVTHTRLKRKHNITRNAYHASLSELSEIKLNKEWIDHFKKQIN